MGKVTSQRDGQDVMLERRRTAFILCYSSETQKLYMHRDNSKMAPRSLKLNAAAQTMNSGVLLTMIQMPVIAIWCSFRIKQNQ